MAQSLIIYVNPTSNSAIYFSFPPRFGDFIAHYLPKKRAPCLTRRINEICTNQIHHKNQFRSFNKLVPIETDFINHQKTCFWQLQEQFYESKRIFLLQNEENLVDQVDKS